MQRKKAKAPRTRGTRAGQVVQGGVEPEARGSTQSSGVSLTSEKFPAHF